MSPYIPEDLMDILPLITPDPETWFDGQFIAYVFRPNDDFLPQFHAYHNLNYNAAIHIRRNDKIKEAYFYDIEEYTKVIELYFQIQQANNQQIKNNFTVFIATDDALALNEPRSLLMPIRVLGNISTAETASNISNRYLPDSHNSLIQDFFQLANADFLLCTFSSNLGRLVYEYRTATKYTNSDLYEVMSMDLNPFGDFPRNYQSIHARNVQDINELNFEKNVLIYVPKHKIKTEIPKRYFGVVQKPKGTLKHFLRSSVSKVYSVSNNFPPISMN